jgi:hypothetical protein
MTPASNTWKNSSAWIDEICAKPTVYLPAQSLITNY